jgi:Holliday junction resolvasome RuvABC endonuclease subunit
MCAAPITSAATSRNKKKMKLLVGLDISVQSPAVCVGEVDEKDNNVSVTKWHWACFAQRNKDFSATIPPEVKNVSLTVYPRIPTSQSLDLIRYQHIIKYFMSFLSKFNPSINSTKIAVEGYAFVPAHLAGSSYKLHEVTGALKCEIFRRWGILTQTIAVGTWKKLTCKKGNAKKLDVVEMVKHILNIDTLSVFDISVSKSGEVPVPVQDICDSFGIALALQKLHDDVVVIKKRKISTTTCQPKTFMA